MSNIPPSWVECALGNVIAYGETTKAEPTEIPQDAWVLELEDIEKDTSRILNRMTFQERQSKSTKNRFVAGDVLYGKLRPYLNKVVRAPSNGYCTTEILPLSPTEAVNGDYLFYWLKHPRFLDYVTGVSHGLNMPRLGTEAGQRAPFVLAPLNEQKRIAEKLDSLLARVDACRERLDRIPTILKRLRQSILAAACSGKLTADWRAARDFADDWETGILEDVIDGKPRNGYSPRAVEFETSVKALTLSATTSGRLRLEHYKYIDETIPSDSHLWLQDGDILIQRANTLEYVGVNVLFRGPAHTFIYPDLMMKCRANNRVIPQFLNYVLLNDTVREYFRANATGTAGNMPKINQQTVLNAPVSWPSISEQQEIVERVERLFSFAEMTMSRLIVAHREVQQLTPACLSKAFRGELVPQDPNDEPAEELLTRIRHAIASDVSKPGEKKSGKRIPKKKAAETMLKRADVQSNHLTEILRSHDALTAEALWSLSQLEIDDFYDQLKAEEEKGLLKERRKKGADEVRLLEVA